jgi:hypothetical protein
LNPFRNVTVNVAGWAPPGFLAGVENQALSSTRRRISRTGMFNQVLDSAMLGSIFSAWMSLTTASSTRFSWS